MSKYCSDCVHMNTNNMKQDGVYKCEVIKQYTNACNDACEKFDTSYGRNSAEKQRLYDLGKEVNNESISSEGYIFIIILIIILIIIAKLNGY